MELLVSKVGHQVQNLDCEELMKGASHNRNKKLCKAITKHAAAVKKLEDHPDMPAHEYLEAKASLLTHYDLFEFTLVKYNERSKRNFRDKYFLVTTN